MANTAVMAYIHKKSVIHELTGTSKFITFMLLNLSIMLTFDTRILLGMLLFSLFIFRLGKLKFQEVKVMAYFMLFFLSVNTIFVYLFAPEQGTVIYGTRTVLLEGIGRYTVTAEQLFYMFNVCLKYLVSLPIAILFVSTTNPSEFASSLNRVGISYRISYAVALALRYIPDIQREFHEISQAQQSRGVQLGKNESLLKRLKNSINILLPLILSSIERIETVSSAMELRGFGKHKKRTWYMEREFKTKDYICVAVGVAILITSFVVTYSDGNRFFNPFI